MEDFMLRGLLGGVGVAIVTGPVGCFIVWRKMAYFGDSMSHTALLGVAIGFAFGIDLRLGTLAACIGLALVLLLLQNQRKLPTDTLLGVLSHTALSVGIIAVSLMETLRVDLMGYLFGDILAGRPGGFVVDLHRRRGCLVRARVDMARSSRHHGERRACARRGGPDLRRETHLHASDRIRHRHRHEADRDSADHLDAHHTGGGGPGDSPKRPSRWRCSRSSRASSPWRWGYGPLFSGTRPRGPSIVVAAALLFLVSAFWEILAGKG